MSAMNEFPVGDTPYGFDGKNSACSKNYVDYRCLLLICAGAVREGEITISSSNKVKSKAFI